MRTVLLTAFALVAFAANSILCRIALGRDAIDPVAFTTIRLVSGALALLLISGTAGGARAFVRSGTWVSGAMLFAYAICFSFAYVRLTTGTGALLLFGAVQVTMIAGALRAGERPRPLEWVGLVIAIVGLVYLVSPGLTAPHPVGSVMMAAAGAAWGVYTLRGRRTTNPLGNTTGNFARTVPLVAIVAVVSISSLHASWGGVVLAVASGAIASGVGYVVWYAALRHLTVTRAAALQLSVPVLAAIAGAALLSEAISLRLVASTFAILGGIGLVLVSRRTT